jgi:hypothetical protein
VEHPAHVLETCDREATDVRFHTLPQRSRRLSIRRLPRFAIAALAMVATAVGAAAALMHTNEPPRASVANATGVNGNVAGAAAEVGCAGTGGPLGWLALVPDTDNFSAMAARGAKVGMTLTGRDGITIATLHGSNPTEMLAARVTDGLVSSGLVNSAELATVRSANSALESCDMKLADAPAAQPYIAATEQAAIARQLATSDAFTNTASPFVVTDDPFDSNAALVLLDIPGPPVSNSPQGGPGTVYQQRTIAALVDRSTLSVISMGHGSW